MASVPRSVVPLPNLDPHPPDPLPRKRERGVASVPLSRVRARGGGVRGVHLHRQAPGVGRWRQARVLDQPDPDLDRVRCCIGSSGSTWSRRGWFAAANASRAGRGCRHSPVEPGHLLPAGIGKLGQDVAGDMRVAPQRGRLGQDALGLERLRRRDERRDVADLAVQAARRQPPRQVLAKSPAAAGVMPGAARRRTTPAPRRSRAGRRRRTSLTNTPSDARRDSIRSPAGGRA